MLIELWINGTKSFMTEKISYTQAINVVEIVDTI